MKGNFPNFGKRKRHASPGSKRVPNKMDAKRPTPNTINTM